MAAIENVNGDLRLTLAFRLDPGAQDVQLDLGSQQRPANWSVPFNVVRLLSTEPCPDGTDIGKVRGHNAVGVVRRPLCPPPDAGP